MPTLSQDKYHLKSIYEEIDLFDRKLAHLLKYDAFPTEADRAAAARKMAAKRNLLVTTARQMVEHGVEFKASELPRSLRTAQDAATEEILNPPQLKDGTLLSFKSQAAERQPSPYAGTSLDVQQELKERKRKKAKL